jgi:Flp pilus assembly protein TadG
MNRSPCIDKWKRLHGQRGIIVIWLALLMPLLFGLMALAIDVARFNLTRIQVQNAAEASALAGARKFALTGKPASATSYASSFARRNYANGKKIPDSAITIEPGYWDLSDPAETWHTTHTGTDAYAVRVTINLGTAFKYFIAPALGITSPNVQATAIAAQQSSVVSDHAILVQ